MRIGRRRAASRSGTGAKARSRGRLMRVHAGYVKADLGALELARGIAPPGLQLVDSVARDPYLSGITAGRYFAETRAHGSPAYYSPAQLEAALPYLRQAADSVLASAY